MPDLLWDEVRNFFDPDLMGALPDVFVLDASVEDWQSLFGLVQARNWQWQYSTGPTQLPLPLAAALLARSAGSESAELRVWPAPGVLAIFRVTSADEIDFDVDLRELQGQEGVDLLCGLLAQIGRELGKPVVMTSEGGSPAHPVLGFDPALDRVVALADPSFQWATGAMTALSIPHGPGVPGSPDSQPSVQAGQGCPEWAKPSAERR